MNTDEIEALLVQIQRGLEHLRSCGAPTRSLGLAPDGVWTPGTLASALKRIYADVDQASLASGQSGRDSEVFLFYDGGLAAVMERLAQMESPGA